MNKILLDTNIILDIALERREFFEKSKELVLTTLNKVMCVQNEYLNHPLPLVCN